MSTSEDRLAKARAQTQRGRELREKAQQLEEQGKTNEEIAQALGIPVANVRNLVNKPELEEHETMWFPGIYGGRQYSPWTKIATHINFDHLVALVQKRAKQDGEWAIENGHVGDNEDIMRKMMDWVSEEKHIRQCVDHIHAEGKDDERTVDWVCRDLANGSKWVGGSRD
jgi:hypothetical protein